MPVPNTEAHIDRELLRDKAYTTLRAAILHGRLEPGERLHADELCKWLGLSRTPIRGALARLEDDGLVETLPQRYTRVTPLDRRAIRDTAQIVASVHALATELAVPNLTEAELDELTRVHERFAAALEAADVDEAMAADDAFHGVFVTASGNGEIERTIARLLPRLRRIESLRFGTISGRRSVAQHAHIIDLARSGDPIETAAAVRENWLTLATLLDASFPDDGVPNEP
jgi:DNA-binding GntR family transcriptional regulator